MDRHYTVLLWNAKSFKLLFEPFFNNRVEYIVYFFGFVGFFDCFCHCHNVYFSISKINVNELNVDDEIIQIYKKVWYYAIVQSKGFEDEYLHCWIQRKKMENSCGKGQDKTGLRQ